MAFDTPILLIAFSRADTAVAVINSVRQVKPSNLYLACDGPRNQVVGEEELCRLTRDAIEAAIDWPCKVHRLYQKENLGCRNGPVKAINWFFSQVEEGIILEDDVVPSENFYFFCQELLSKYRYDNRVGVIGGNYLSLSDSPKSADYVFSRFIQAWGWASWRRAWSNFDANMASWPIARDTDLLRDAGGVDFARYLSKCFDKAAVNNNSIWDYIWMYSSIKEGYLCCHPTKQLISNIGFDERATHTKSGASPLRPIEAMDFPLKHPEFFVPNKAYDEEILYVHLGGGRVGAWGLIKKIFKRVLR
jgi:hypothetical protein